MKTPVQHVLAACELAVSCAAAQAQTEPVPQPLAEFDAIVARCQRAFDARPMSEVAFAPATGAWVKRMHAPTEIAPRAQKTPSTVTPYVAQITITEMASAQRADDADTVRALAVPMDQNVLRSTRRINLAYQNNNWTVIGGTATTEVKRDAEDPFTPVHTSKLGRDAVLALEGPIASCVDMSRD